MTVKVVRSTEVNLQPRAFCLGNDPDPDAPSNCDQTWDHGRGTLPSVKTHIKANPTHIVITVHETRSVYEAQG